MNLSTRIFSASAMLGIALAASNAPAQVTYVSQSRSVSVTGCFPGPNQSRSAPAFGTFNESLSCFGQITAAQATQNSTLGPGAISLVSRASSGRDTGSSSSFRVEFDVSRATQFTLNATNNIGMPMHFTGPGVDFHGLGMSSGILTPGRYAVENSIAGMEGPVTQSSLQMTFSLLPFDSPWSTLDCGGGNLSGGDFNVSGTIGQADAALPVLTGADFRIVLGYWARDPGTPPCVADFDDGTGTGQPDGGVTIDDLLYYLEVFRQGSASADVDDGSFTGVPDGGVTVDDLLYYLLRFADGC